MPNYDFKSLSPWEFEQLSRDLLRANLGLDFELFKSGRDQGIDLRYSPTKGNDVIAQCKHYANSNYSNLKANLKYSEIRKIKKLSPHRYILITSLGLTTENKEDISKILGSYLLSFSDIITKETLNGWLGDHPSIEKTHIKLWATTTAVMEKIIHSGIFNYTITQIDFLKEKLSYYVKNSSFEEASTILKDQGFCIIAGMPGIGKTTLAEMLLIDFMNRGYDPIRISSDINEAFKTYNPTKLQAFYYDDFLGQTGLEQKLNKNEDQRIADFCRLCAKSTRTVFIMTTREYILNQAKNSYEKLERSGLDLKKCVIDMSSYALMDRAKILYNHLYFRGLPRDYIAEIIKDRKYLQILQHKSFNPRVIEWMTDSISVAHISANRYAQEFIARLDHPSMIWEHAYNHQISDASKHLLLAILSLPNIVQLSDCKKAYESLRKQYCTTFGETRTHNEFNLALKECEGNFLRIDLAAGRQTVQFHNPSIRDYLTHFLSYEEDIFLVLIKSIEIFDQLVSLWNSFSPLVNNPLQQNKECNHFFQERLAGTLGTKSVRLTRYRSFDDTVSYVYTKYSTGDQIRFVLNQEFGFVCDFLAEKIKDVLAVIFFDLSSIYEWVDTVSLLSSIKDAKPEYRLDINSYLNRTLDVLPYNLSQVDDYRQLAEICKKHPQAHARLSGNFSDYAKSLERGLEDELRYISSADDIATLEEYADDIRAIVDLWGVDLSNALSRIQEIIQSIEQHHEVEEDEPVRHGLSHPIADESEMIISMFETLD